MSAQLPQGAELARWPTPPASISFKSPITHCSYVLAAADLACECAVYVGHEPAGVTTSPVLLSKHLVIAENRGARPARCMSWRSTAAVCRRPPSNKSRAAGHVLAPPVVLSGKLLVATDEGRVTAYESAAKPASGLKEIAKADVSSGPGSAKEIARYPMIAGDGLLVAGRGLSLLAPPTGGTLKPVWEVLGDDVLVAPPQVAGNTIVHASPRFRQARRHRRWSESYRREAALENAAGRSRAASRTGRRQGLARRGSDILLGVEDQAELFRRAQGHVACARRQNPASAPPPWDCNSSPGAMGKLSITPAGTISYVDSATGSAPKAEPLQLRLRPGMRLVNCRAAAVGERKHNLRSATATTFVPH